MDPIMQGDLDLPYNEPTSDPDENADAENVKADTAMEEPEEKIPIDDYDAMWKKHCPNLPDLETLEQTVSTWDISDYRSLDSKRMRGPTFECGKSPWRVLLFPFGNAHADGWVSVYLEHGFEQVPEDWYACAQFLLVLSNPNDPTVHKLEYATHRFEADAADWGFTRFVEVRRAYNGSWNDKGRPLIEDDKLTITAFVRVVKDPTGVLWHSFNNYDSKKQTGMVGLKNQGATCYLNSLLQSLYFTNSFRKAIYQIPTDNETSYKDNSAYALQRLFYQLQKSDQAVSTNELTIAFDWQSRQIFEQQDVQELCRILLERMEERMKGTEAEKALPNLFVGQMKTYIQCINVDYESSRPEEFWDIQLNVRGNKTLDDSFRDYIQVETMEGENKYFAEGFGLQDAKKGVIFERFPNVLHLQLKRFEYNFQLDTMTKIYDLYEFPEVWDASPYLSQDADRSEPYIYHLHGVLVHSGDLNAGHYYAFLKPKKNGDFYKFDDDRVTKATKKEAMDENFGGEFGPGPNGAIAQRNPFTKVFTKQRFMSAYMLVYIRESKLDSVLHGITDSDIPEHLAIKVEEERAEAERKKKEREEAHLYMNVSVGTDANFNAHQGFDLFPPSSPNPEIPATPKSWRILRSTTVFDFKKILAEAYEGDPERIRLWTLVGRQNGTSRPDKPISSDDISMEEAYLKASVKSGFRVYMEVLPETKRDSDEEWVEVSGVANAQHSLESEEAGKDEPMTTPPASTESPKTLVKPSNGELPPDNSILLFLKHFDAEKQTLSGQGHIYIGKFQKTPDLAPLVLERMGWKTGTNIKLYEEITASMIESVNIRKTFAESEIGDGDIICFQQAYPEDKAAAISQAGNYVDAPKFYDYLLNKVTINFSEKSDPTNMDNHFALELSKKMSYNQLAAKVGEHLKVDPTHLRFSCVLAANGKPRNPVKPAPSMTLGSILSPHYGSFSAPPNQRLDWLCYEVLEMSLSELETMKAFKIILLSEGISKEEIFDVLVPKTGSVKDLVIPLQKKAKLSDEAIGKIRFYEGNSNKYYRELLTDHTVADLNEFVPIYAEQIPQEELDADPEVDRAVYAFHFDKEPHKVHGVPFNFIVHPDENFKETRERLSKRTGIKGKQLEKIKFAVVSRSAYSQPYYLEDDDVLYDKLSSIEDMLGLDHINKARNLLGKANVMMIR